MWNGLPEGLGTLTFTNGSVFEGTFKQGKRTGKGKITYENGNIYSGLWVNDEYSG